MTVIMLGQRSGAPDQSDSNGVGMSGGIKASGLRLSPAARALERHQRDDRHSLRLKWDVGIPEV
jgi:hypothetical protein